MFRIWSYNAGASRTNEAVAGDIRAILRTRSGKRLRRPAILVIVEAISYRLPQIKGYTLFRDTSRPGRANVAVYVRTNLTPCMLGWRDMDETWGRTEHDGIHPPRSYPLIQIGGMYLIAWHQPPKFTDNTLDAQREQIDAVVRTVKTRGIDRLTLIGDQNRGVNEDPGLRLVAERVGGGHVVGTSAVDNALVVGARTANVKYPKFAFGRRLRSDHDHGFRFDVPDEALAA